MKVNHEQATQLITRYVEKGIVPLLKGSPGMGKSDIVKHVAKALNRKLIDVRLSSCDPTDLNAA